MPAKDLPSRNLIYHVYNCGVEKRTIFSDAPDYETFEDFLKEYLTPPAEPNSVKKVFTINGRSFRGTPHQPKNYFGQIELIAYSLMPNHFHLIIHQKTPGSLERFIRSLCTRYSMYFNNKNNRRGSLFEGPYKSVQINDLSKLSPLINYIHHGTNDYSSYPEYSGKRENSWVNTNIAPNKGNYDHNQQESHLLDGITFEEKTQYLEKRNLTGNVELKEKTRSRIPEISALFVIFLMLVGLGLRNISISTTKRNADSPAVEPVVLSESTEPTNSPVPKRMVVVKAPEGFPSVNIRQGPTTDSEKIGEAEDGISFEFISENPGWYEIKLPDDSTGFISAEYTYLEDKIDP